MTITPKGQARRIALQDAVVRVLEREGPNGVTHRSVAAEAGLPLAAATYYFDGIDDLLVSALERVTAEEVAMFDALAVADVAGLARALHEYTHTHRAAAIAQYELLFLAMRRAPLRASADRWYGALEDAIARGWPEAAAAPAGIAALAIDGLILRMLWRGEPATPQDTERVLSAILAR